MNGNTRSALNDVPYRPGAFERPGSKAAQTLVAKMMTSEVPFAEISGLILLFCVPPVK